MVGFKFFKLLIVPRLAMMVIVMVIHSGTLWTQSTRSRWRWWWWWQWWRSDHNSDDDADSANLLRQLSSGHSLPEAGDWESQSLLPGQPSVLIINIIAIIVIIIVSLSSSSSSVVIIKVRKKILLHVYVTCDQRHHHCHCLCHHPWIIISQFRKTTYSCKSTEDPKGLNWNGR